MPRGALIDQEGNVVDIIDAASDNDPQYSKEAAFVINEECNVGDIYDSSKGVFSTTVNSKTSATPERLRIAMSSFGLTDEAIERIFKLAG